MASAAFKCSPGKESLLTSKAFKCCLFCSKQISEPLMTYPLYDTLIDAASNHWTIHEYLELLCSLLELPYNDRIAAITCLVNKLPSLNYKVLNDFITSSSVYGVCLSVCLYVCTCVYVNCMHMPCIERYYKLQVHIYVCICSVCTYLCM